jgi:serine/threonine-protein kinase
MADDTMPAMTLAAGARVSKSLVLVRLLGRGGMGSVWVARHEGLDRDVAVKFVSDELRRSGDDAVLARFSREAKLAAKIDSPHVVRVFDHGETDDGVPFIVMELLRGESLAERLARDARLSPRALADVVRQVARGLEDAHALGVVHRDIKPQNIFFASAADGTETVKIVDFGIAKSDAVTDAASSATSSGVIVGTPQYMSPEQLMRAGSPDRSADVWALAVVAYESLVGRPPFVGETLAATLVAITKSELEPPSSAVPGRPGGVDAFFGRAFAPI